MEEKTYSQDIAEAVNKYLTEAEWKFSFDEKIGLFRFSISISGKIKKISYVIDIKKEEYIVYAICPIGADVNDKNMMTEAAEFVCRANYGLKNGNFEFDMRDGEIRFKSFVDCNGSIPVMEIISDSIICPCAMFERYGSGIADIVLGNAAAKEAIEKCENR